MTAPVAIIGAGPYGLSIAAHLRARGIGFRIFGRPMHSWRECMPQGMFLKSEPFASNLYDPDGFGVESFCRDHGLAYEPRGVPLPLDTFTRYGLAFQQRLVPEVEDRRVVALDAAPGRGFLLRLDDGEAIAAERVVVAVGISYFAHLPAALAHLPPDAVSHSSEHHDLSRFAGRDVSVLGAGASALDVAAALDTAGAEVRLVARRTRLRFNLPETRRRLLPVSGLGGGWRNQFYEHAPQLFYRLPLELRLWIVATALGPSGGAPVKERLERVPQLLGHTLRRAVFRDGRVQLTLLDQDGDERIVPTDHVVAATGYRVDLRRLDFLAKTLRGQLQAVAFTPVLSADFESSVPGLYFVGLAAANTFGPVMRFLLGARHTARRLARHLAAPATAGR